MSSRAAAAPPLLEARVGPARVWCSGRAHGNVGDHVGDDPGSSRANRAALGRARPGSPRPDGVGVDPPGARRRGATSRPAAPGRDRPRRPWPTRSVTARARAAARGRHRRLRADRRSRRDDAVGVVHAGHRGLAAGVIEAAVARAARRSAPATVRAFLGPCIRAARYEFGAADLARVRRAVRPDGRRRARATGRPALDIPAAVRVVLERAGVDDVRRLRRLHRRRRRDYFSYRRDGATGRQATIAVLA